MEGPAAVVREPSERWPFLAELRAKQCALDALELQLTELWGHMSAAEARFMELLAELDRLEGWGRHGCASCAHWLNWRCGIGMVAARERVRVARALEHLPLIRAEFRAGRISYSKVRAMTRIATPDSEEDLLNIALHGTASHVEKLVRKYRWVERLEEAERAHGVHQHRYLSFDPQEDGSVMVRGKLAPEVAAVVRKAIHAAMEVLEKFERTEQATERAERAGRAERTERAEGTPADDRGTGDVAVCGCCVSPAHCGPDGLETGSNVSAEASFGTPSGNAPAQRSVGTGGWKHYDVLEEILDCDARRAGSKVPADAPRADGVTEVPAESGSKWGDADLADKSSVFAQAPRRPATAASADRTRSDVVREAALQEREQASFGARHADALAFLAEHFLQHRSSSAGSVADRYQVVVHIDQALLARQLEGEAFGKPRRCGLEEGPALTVETVRRLACDASLVGIVEDEAGDPLNVGRRTRSIPAALQRALAARDGGCRFPGCDRTRFTDGHHVKHWAQGGETKLGNLVTLCTFHHRLVHEGGFGVKVAADGAFLFTRPDGSRIRENGYPAAMREARVRADNDAAEQSAEPPLFALNRARGLDIDAETIRCRWDGATMDYGIAVGRLFWLRDQRERVMR